jgi:hypothetical protein
LHSTNLAKDFFILTQAIPPGNGGAESSSAPRKNALSRSERRQTEPQVVVQFWLMFDDSHTRSKRKRGNRRPRAPERRALWPQDGRFPRWRFGLVWTSPYRTTTEPRRRVLPVACRATMKTVSLLLRRRP